MITNKQIEEQDYSTNDIADLKMRLDLAVEALNAVAGTIKNGSPMTGYKWAVNTHARILGEHNHSCDGDVSLNKKGEFCCQCMLIASAEH